MVWMSHLAMSIVVRMSTRRIERAMTTRRCSISMIIAQRTRVMLLWVRSR